MKLALVLAIWVALVGGVASAQPQGLPTELLRECPSPDRLPTGPYREVLRWEAEGPTVGRSGGRRIDDPTASDGAAWVVEPGIDQPGTPLFGPYTEGLAAGEYVAFVRVRTEGERSEEPYGTLDACTDYAQTILAAWELMGSDFAAEGWSEVPLGFRYFGGKLECRLTWNGYAPVVVDCVSLYRLEGGGLDASRWRAPEAVPSGEPSQLDEVVEPRPFPDIFPISEPPARELAVFDARALPPDRRLATYVLQGIVNREQPVLYVITQPYDNQWLGHMVLRGWIDATYPITSFEELLETFGGVLHGAIIHDPALPASKNVATMLASLEDALVVSPRLASELKLPVLDDLRGRWKTSVEAYRWAFDNLWPRLSHHVIACSWPEHFALRDYLVQHKVFIFWLSGALDGARPYADPTAEARLMEELLARMPANIPVMSYPWAGKDIGIGEGPGVTLFAEFGKHLVGTIDTPNLSVHSGIRVPELKQKPAPPLPTAEQGKVYYSFIMSDGDNLPVLTTSNFPALWSEKTRGKLPMGWTLSPSASILLPDLVDWYYENATPSDAFLGAVSGVGYTYPDSYGKRFREGVREQVYDAFLADTAHYMERSDLHDIWIMNATRPEVIARYAEVIPSLGALFPDYGRRLVSGDTLTYPTARNVPVFHAATTWNQEETREQRIERMVRDLREAAGTERPAFLHAFVLNWFADLGQLREVADRLGREFVCVRPDHLTALYGQHLAGRKLLLRMPTSLAAIEGRRLRIEARIQNVTQNATRASISVVSGLDRPRITPETLDLPSGEPRRITVEGDATGAPAAVRIESGLATEERTLPLHIVPSAEVLPGLPEAGALTAIGVLEAEGLAHRIGERVDAPAASGGASWLARKGMATAGYLVFGPYAPLEAGRYVALFAVRRTSEGSGELLLLDAGPAGGQAKMVTRAVDCGELPLEQTRYVPIVFDHTGDAYETRAHWSGAASLEVDAVLLWRLAE